MINKIYQIVIVAMAVIIAFLFIDSCNEKKKSEDLYGRLGDQDRSLQVYKDASGKNVEYQPVQKFEDLSQIKGLKAKIDSMKIKHAWLYAKYKMEFRVDTISYSIRDSIPCPPFFRDINIDSSFFKMSAMVTNKEFKIITLRIPNDLVVVIGEKKYKWYQLNKKDTTSVFVQNSNKKVSGKQLEPYLIIPAPKKWSVGASAGYGAVFNNTGVHTGPTISIGITRSLFSF